MISNLEKEFESFKAKALKIFKQSLKHI